MTTNRRSAQLLAATCAALTESIGRHMPAGPYRDFATWAFSTRNPHQREFLQATGVLQMINLNTTLLSGLIDDDDWPALLDHTGKINAYQVTEVVSDNLAFGLGGPSLDQGALSRRALVSSVNRAMIEALSPGRSTPALLLLAGHAQRAAQEASGFHHSLATATHAEMAEHYRRHLAEREIPAPSLAELEYGVWPTLVTGVEVCREIAEALAGTASEGLLRQGLSDRYRAVERTLLSQHLSRLELAMLGAQTILVIPTLAYFLGLLLEKIKPVKAFPAIVKDGSLAETLTDAALLVRLQNDIGTQLLRLTPVQQAIRLRTLEGDRSVLDALSGNAEALFTRLHKDVRTAESNVALWHARRAESAAQAWTALAESLACYSAMYSHHSNRLARGLAELDERLGDRRASALIERLVRFHERMYSQRHTESAGEYAI